MGLEDHASPDRLFLVYCKDQYPSYELGVLFMLEGVLFVSALS